MSDARPDTPDKPALRAWAKRRRADLDPGVLSQHLVERVAALPEFVAARHVLLYLAMPDEVNVEGLLSLADNADQQRRFYVPRCAPQRRLAVHPFTPGQTPLVARPPFGIREPDPQRVPEADPAALDLVIVPALVLSEQGDRVGYGGGYYDRFLPRLAPGCALVGALPGALVLPQLPCDDWDIPLDVVVTETRIWRRGV